MDKPFEYVKALVLNYKLETCCCVAPIRVGLIFTGYFNAILAVICLQATANESFPPTIVKVQEMILADYSPTKTIPLLAYCTELGFSCLLLCATYRNDLVLLRIYMYYCMAAIVLSLLVYSMVIAAIDVLIQITIILGSAFQVYVLLLVRSAMVEIRMSRKNGGLPTLVMSSLLQKDEETKQFGDEHQFKQPEVKLQLKQADIKPQSTQPDVKSQPKETDVKSAPKQPDVKSQLKERDVKSPTKQPDVKTSVKEEVSKEKEVVPEIKVETVEEKPKETTTSKSKSIFLKLKRDNEKK